MWERLENYHADLGGPEYRLAPRVEGRLAALHARPHRAQGPPLPRRGTRQDRGRLPPGSDPRTAEGLRAPIVRTHLRPVCRSGPTESGSGGIARERGARVVPVASRRKGRFVRAHAERDRPALLEENGIRADRPHLGPPNLTSREAIISWPPCNLKQG